MTVKARRLVTLLTGVALILVVLALQLLTPGAQIDQTGPENAHIRFRADQGVVFAPGGCISVHWQVDHVQGVYLGTLPTVGQGIALTCVDNHTMPLLHVEFHDGSTQDYRLEVEFLVEQPITWLLAVMALLLLLLSLYVTLSRPAVPQTQSVSRFVRWFSMIGIMVSTVIVMALLWELGLRFYFGQFGTFAEQDAYLHSRSEINQHQNPLMPLPFVEYGLSPDFPGHNQLGYRGDEIEIPKPNGVYRIVALGDSSTYGSYVPYDQTYPYDLQEVLREDYGYPNVEVVNAGVTNYNSWHFVMNLAFRLTELQPDLVIIYAGWNDLDAREQSPDCYSAPSPFLGLDANRELRAESADLSPSALYRFLAINFGWIDNPAQAEMETIDSLISCSPEVISEIQQNLQTNIPVYYQRNLRELISIAKAFDIKLMFMSWAYNDSISYFPEFRRPAIAQHNAITKQIAQENDVLFFDYASIAPTDKNSWSDVAHLTVRGTMEQARDVAQYLVDQKVIPQPAS